MAPRLAMTVIGLAPLLLAVLGIGVGLCMVRWASR